VQFLKLEHLLAHIMGPQSMAMVATTNSACHIFIFFATVTTVMTLFQVIITSADANTHQPSPHKTPHQIE